MANIKMTPNDLRLIMRDLQQGRALNWISCNRSVSRTSIRSYKERALDSGRSWEEILSLDDHDLAELLQRDSGHRRREEDKAVFLEERLAGYAEMMRRRHATFETVYERYRKEAGDLAYGLTWFKERVGSYMKARDLKFHNVHVPGDEVQIDYAGDVLWVVEADGSRSQADVLVMVLPYSGMGFCVAVPKRDNEHTFNGLAKGMTYFGGVPKICRSDNMKQWVVSYDRHDPTFSETAKEFSVHYGTELANTRVRKPRDKAAVEGLVNIFYKKIYSRIAVYDLEFHSFRELNAYLLEMCDDVNGTALGDGRSRRDVYEAEEAWYMLPLPEKEYRYKYVKEFVLGSDYHVSLERKTEHYSVPCQHVGSKGVVRYDYEDVEIFIDGVRVALHKRRLLQGSRWETKSEHMPTDHQMWARSKEHNAAYYEGWAAKIGPATKEAIDNLLKSKAFPVQAYQQCASVLSLCKSFGDGRLEAAVAKAGELGRQVTRRNIKDILDRGLDKAPVDDPNRKYMPDNEDVRGPQEYQ